MFAFVLSLTMIFFQLMITLKITLILKELNLVSKYLSNRSDHTAQLATEHWAGRKVVSSIPAVKKSTCNFQSEKPNSKALHHQNVLLLLLLFFIF